MGGLLGYVGPNAAARADAMAAATTLSRHHADHAGSIFTCMGSVALGAVHRRQAPPVAAYDPQRRVGAVLYGFASTEHPPAAVTDPTAIIDGYLDRGVHWLTDLDGGFVVVVVDDARQRFYLVNDRTATVPVHFAHQGDALAFGPDGKSVLRLLDRPVAFDAVGMLHFLSGGRGVGTRTLFEGVLLLPPGSVIEVAADEHRSSVRRYWQLTFPDAPSRWERGEATEALFDVYLRSLTRFVPDPSDAPPILLTGGHDSRGLLAMALEAGRAPPESLTWGVADDIPDSDPTIARRVSSTLGVPHRFLPYDQSTFASRWKDWAWTGELASDNLGSFAAGPGLLLDARLSGSTVLIGDHALGIGGIPIHRQDAVESTTDLPYQGLPASLRRWLQPDYAPDATTLVWDDVMTLVDYPRGERPKDLKDRLGFEHGTCRWLNAPTYFREPMLTPRRPLLSREALELFVTLPPHLRVDKALMVGLVAERFPDLGAIPTDSANSLVDWSSFFWRDGFMREWFADGDVVRDFLTASPLAPFLGVERVLADYRRAIDVQPALDASLRQANRLSVTSFRRRLSQNHALGRFARGVQILGRRITQRQIGVSTRRLLVRHMLLAGFWQMMVAAAPIEPRSAGEGSRAIQAASWRSR